MRKILIGAALALPFIAMSAPASAMPRTPLEVIAGDTASAADFIEVKGGRGRGHARYPLAQRGRGGRASLAGRSREARNSA